ncbi:MAG: MarR family winged helix-turn-helix transcriptional regulator [Steroidobacteraceae bacterium]|jgi:DNA-binding MarR family transcriptional regulator
MTRRAKLVLDRFIPYRLSMASNLVSDTVATAYEAAFGLRIPEWRLVAVIAEADAISQFEICRRTRMDKVTVSRAAIALADRGLIERRPNPLDQRSHLLALTPGGRELYGRIAPKALAIEAQIFGGFTPAELRALVSMLERIDAAAYAVGAE